MPERYGPKSDRSSRDLGSSILLRCDFRSCGLPRVETLRSRPVRTGTGRDIGVYEYGDPNGRPLFALHGTPSCGAAFDWTDAPARELGLRVIAPDRPGIGHSDAVPMTSVADYSAELGALADALSIDRFLLLGYSGGGPYALAVAHRLAHRVESATVVSGAGEIGAWATWKDLARSDRQLTWASLHAPADRAGRTAGRRSRGPVRAAHRAVVGRDRDVEE